MKNNRTILVKIQIIILNILLVMLLTGCEINTRVKVSRDIPPSFTFSGTGALAQLYISGPFTLEEIKLFAGKKVLTKEETATIKQAIGDDRILWQLDPVNSPTVSNLPKVIYGQIPLRFKQVYPANGTNPAPLVEGNYYIVHAPSYNANSDDTYFLVQKGEVIEIPEDKIVKPN